MQQKWWESSLASLTFGLIFTVGAIVIGLLTYLAQWVIALILLIVGLLLLLRLYIIHKNVITSEVRPDFSIDWVEGRDSYFFRRLDGEYAYETKFEADATALVLDSVLVINTSKPILVESLTLNMVGKIIPSDWKSRTVYKSEQVNVCFDIPLDTLRGKRSVILNAIIDSKEHILDSVLKELPVRPMN